MFRGYASECLNLDATKRFPGERATAANRTRESRPSGMRRGLNRNMNYGEIVTPPHRSKSACRKPLA